MEMNEILEKRARIASLYNEKLKDFKEIELPCNTKSWFVYVVRINNRDRIIRKMGEKGIQYSNYFQPIHLQPYYKKMFGFKKGDFPICEQVSQKTIALPFYNNLQEKEIDFIVKTLRQFL